MPPGALSQHIQTSGRAAEHAAHAKKQIHILFDGDLVSVFHLLAEGHFSCFPHRGHKAQIDFRMDEVREHSRGVRHGSQAVQHPHSRVDREGISSGRGGKQHGADDIGLVCLQHILGVRCPLGGEVAALPGGLQPKHRLFRQHLLFLGDEHIRIVLKSGQGDHAAKFLHIGGHTLAEKAPAQGTMGHEIDLLHEQPLLNGHIFFYGQIQKAAVFLPDLFCRIISELFFECHGHLFLSDYLKDASASLTLEAVGIKNGVVF